MADELITKVNKNEGLSNVLIIEQFLTSEKKNSELIIKSNEKFFEEKSV